MSSDQSNRPHQQDGRSISEQASDWVVELADGGPEVRAVFLQWVRESPRHIEEYLIAAAFYKSLDRADPTRQIDLHDALAEASFNVLPLKTRDIETADMARSPPVRQGGWRALAAACAVGGLLGLWALLPRDHVDYATGVGELRSVRLADGSVVDLNTQSRIEVRYSGGQRTIHLLAGEALFDVAADPARPFSVYANTTLIRALGTRFNVYRHQDDTSVAVIEGAVQISSTKARVAVAAARSNTTESAAPTLSRYSQNLTAGEGASVSSDGELKPVLPINLVKVTAWRERRLVFVDDTLADIVAEFNRYNTAPRMRVEGAYASTRQLTGVFDAVDPRSLVQFLEHLGEFTVDTTDREIVIRQR